MEHSLVLAESLSDLLLSHMEYLEEQKLFSFEAHFITMKTNLIYNYLNNYREFLSRNYKLQWLR